MAFLLPFLAPLLSGITGKILGGEQGVKRVSKKRELIMIHEGELVAPKHLANKIRKDPKYSKDVSKLPKAPQNLSHADKKHLSNLKRRDGAIQTRR